MADPKPDQEQEGLRWNGRRIPLISWITSWPTKKGADISVADFVAIAVIAGIIVAIVLAVENGSNSSGGTITQSQAGGPISTQEESEAGQVSGTSTFVEWSDNTAGSPVFADPTGSPVKGKPGRIPYGTEVVVSCFAPNESGMHSVSGFYRIASGEWQGDYVVTDTMTNGGKVGDTGTPNVDRRVRKC
jgi:hypothetical protein